MLITSLNIMLCNLESHSNKILLWHTPNTCSVFFNDRPVTMENCEYKSQSSQSLTSWPLIRMKYFENECFIFSMFVL